VQADAVKGDRRLNRGLHFVLTMVAVGMAPTLLRFVCSVCHDLIAKRLFNQITLGRPASYFVSELCRYALIEHRLKAQSSKAQLNLCNALKHTRREQWRFLA
jgi:hypothetical protein